MSNKIENPVVLIHKRENHDSYAVAITNGSHDYYDGLLMASVSPDEADNSFAVFAMVGYYMAAEIEKLRVELEIVKQREKDLFMENVRLKSGIAGLIHLGIRYADVEVMKIAGDAQLSTPCTDSIINSIASGVFTKEVSIMRTVEVRAEDVTPGDVVITSKGKRCAVKSFWMEGDKVTLFGTDGSETDYDYDELLVVERAI
ncbi:hypothetical protein [Escherichia coli]|uniref:hypothetical protein n=1 Tax=Escherichia coli TaxID=562 RepID=UPI00403D001A